MINTGRDVMPITPDEVSQEIPNYVIEGANECIKDHYLELHRKSNFTQDELIEYITKAYYRRHPDSEVSSSSLRATLFDKCYLDIEPIYIKVGWKVDYDRPGIGDTYPANFTFYKQ